MTDSPKLFPGTLPAPRTIAPIPSDPGPTVDGMVPSVIDVPTTGRALTAHHPLGTSTGHLVELRGQWDMLVRRALDVSTLAVELAALSEPEFVSLCGWLAQNGDGLPFDFVSVHAPTKHRELPEEELVERLLALPPSVDAIVLHPDAMERPERYAALGATAAIENMDARKPGGRTAAELAPIFAALPEAAFCLDVPHAQSIDPTLDEAHRLLDAYGERLRHVHVSSLDAGCHHVPLTTADEQAFLPVLGRCCDVPWILESALPTR